jgi:hypothetical protein
MTTKAVLLAHGAERMSAFVQANPGVIPELVAKTPKEFHLADRTCAYYRHGRIIICPDACAAPGTAGRQWSWPGYVVDRTPYGVVQHELGHHYDACNGEQEGVLSSACRRITGEDAITSYCPNTAEWFAEIFRLFVTNPDLLEALRPMTYRWLGQRFKIVEGRDWRNVLADAPERTQAAAQNKVDAAARRRR